MKIALWRGTQALEHCAEAWRGLEAPPGRPEVGPFQRLAWARAWLATFGTDYEVWIFAAGEPVEALLPLALVRRRGLRLLRFLGHGVSDYLGTIPLDARVEIYRAFGVALAGEAARFDLLDLQSLHASPDRRLALAQGLGRAYAERLYERCPVVDTSGDWAGFLTERKKKFRANLKRAERRVGDHGEPVAAREKVSPLLFDELVKVEQESWKWSAGNAYLRDDRSRRFLSSLLLSDPLPHELWTLRIGGDLAGFAVVLLAEDARYYYLPSFRERYPDAGTWLLAAIVRDSFDGPCREFDFLRGDESYKLAWAQREREVHELVAAGDTPLARIALAAVRLRWRLAQSPRVRRLRDALLKRVRARSPG